MGQCCLKMWATAHKQRGEFKSYFIWGWNSIPWQSSIWKKYSSWLVPWESFALVPIWTKKYLLWGPLWDIWTSSEVWTPGFWRQQILVPTAWNNDIFTMEDSRFRGNLSRHQNIFSERLIFRLNTYTLIWKTENNLIFLFASTLMKRDQYINQASFPTDQMVRKTLRRDRGFYEQ